MLARGGREEPGLAARVPVTNARGALTSRSPTSSAAVSTGSPHQKPRPTNTATNSGANAVPSPSRALSTSTDESTLVGLNAAVNVFSAGTVKPKPMPRLVVASNSKPYATGSLLVNSELTTRSV